MGTVPVGAAAVGKATGGCGWCGSRSSVGPITAGTLCKFWTTSQTIEEEEKKIDTAIRRDDKIKYILAAILGTPTRATLVPKKDEQGHRNLLDMAVVVVVVSASP